MNPPAKGAWQTIAQRKSVRGFRPEAIDQSELEQLFAMAQRAPSWCNTQPWRVWVTGPAQTQKLAAELQQAARSGMPAPEIPFPIDYPEPYKQHRRSCGGALYQAMGIAREDKASRYDAWLRNYAVFDAPHLVVVAQDRRLGQYATLDIGVWLGYLLAAAQLMGIDTCPMASIASYPGPLRRTLAIGEELIILCGIALGREDEEVPANRCRTTREPVSSNVQFVGF